MKHLICLILLLFCSTLSFGQTVEGLVKKGIAYHDAGNYQMAIEKYQAALEIDKGSSVAMYEMALSYYYSRDLENAGRYSEMVFEKRDDHFLPAGTIYASVLDDRGLTDKAIEVYKKLLVVYPDKYLLHFNVAVSFSRLGETADAEYHLIKALQNNFGHGSSHYLISEIEEQKGERVKSILACYFFLLIEDPNSERAQAIFSQLMRLLGAGVESSEDMTLNLTIPANSNSDFGAAEMMIGLTAVSRLLPESADQSEAALFFDQTKSVLSILSELHKDNTGFWWDQYVTFFGKMISEGHLEAYAYYISQNQWKESSRWLEENEEAFNAFVEWANEE